MKIVIRTKREMPKAVKKLLNYTGKNRLIAFYGSMGAGKTTIIKAICESLGATDAVASPTFTLVNEYKTSDGDSLYHIDLYRIKKRDEVFDFGIEEYLSSGFYCFMEWPEVIEDILPPETVKIRITVGPDEERILEIP
ncbi:MAG: tRNA (adenosine(37)-N6)-threonylcarbamoyltransferase complex ATPase subunit type 1 TsaE [Bacteroidales bacterium]|jgi:tRNA threonylcarbamoyladenosine biosynthesis protein TsaE|nr:tRNA (adenosine(37)-N6)-threonylcarbamoyltransferase complex ATPase subunit type 1 TsaE [Bacteroidales bacterium]